MVSDSIVRTEINTHVWLLNLAGKLVQRAAIIIYVMSILTLGDPTAPQQRMTSLFAATDSSFPFSRNRTPDADLPSILIYIEIM